MKYGPIICDPNSDEAKRLIGKKILGGYNYVDTIGGIGEVVTLDSMDSSCQSPFLGYSSNGNPFTYVFIREVIEEPPQYRPYKDTNEMVEDYKERFADIIMTGSVEMPLIWLKASQGSKILITAFSGSEEHVSFSDGGYGRMDGIFRDYTYLDGSPVGKEDAND